MSIPFHGLEQLDEYISVIPIYQSIISRNGLIKALKHKIPIFSQVATQEAGYETPRPPRYRKRQNKVSQIAKCRRANTSARQGTRFATNKTAVRFARGGEQEIGRLRAQALLLSRNCGKC